MGYGVWDKSKSKSNACVNEEVDSLEIVPIYLAVCCKVRKANFTSFPSKSPDKARAVFKLYLGVRSKLKKRTITIFLKLLGNCVCPKLSEKIGCCPSEYPIGIRTFSEFLNFLS